MSRRSGPQCPYFRRIIVFAAVAGIVLSSSARFAKAEGSIFLEPLQEVFSAKPLSTPPAETDATKFTITPQNYNVAANSTGNTFVWTFTADNSAGGNAHDITFTI